MSTNSRPQNDLPDIQTKNPNPPNAQPPDPGLPIGRPQERERTAPPANPSNDTNPIAPQDSRLGSQDSSPGRPATHGLRRRRLFIAPEDAERFERFRRHMIIELHPEDHTENFFVEAIIAKRWLILHCDEAEAAAMRNAFANCEEHSASQIESKSKYAPKDDDERYDRAIAHTCTNERVHLVLRYRIIHERALFKFETALRQYRLTREAREIADLRRGTGFQPVNDSSSTPAPRVNVVNHWGQGMTLTKQPCDNEHRHDDGLPFGESTPTASKPGLPINRSPDDECGARSANPLATPVDAPSEISNLKSSPHIHPTPRTDPTSRIPMRDILHNLNRKQKKKEMNRPQKGIRVEELSPDP
ncbi:MAG: hypothetical protein HZA51_17160 [Planctomycetes bacterium]|nr:hypothetical protein [Planctomycetota bacterium]